MRRRIFREVALERLSTPEQLDQTMRVISPAGWLVQGLLLMLVVFVLVLGFVGTVPEKFKGKGILINPGGVVDVVTSSHGRITRFLVLPGEWVKTGQIVAEMAQPDIENDLETTRARLVEAESQYAKLSNFQNRDKAIQLAYLTQRRQALDQQKLSARARLQWLRERQAVETGLLAKGLIQTQRVVNTKIEINGAREELERIENDMKRLVIEDSTIANTRDKERIDQEARVAGLRRDVAIIGDKLRRATQVVSAYSGVIVEFKVNAGEVIEPGRALFSMLPQAEGERGGGAGRRPLDLQAKLYLRPEDGKKIRPGMAAQISPSTVKREEYGYIEATVIDVAQIPSSEEGIMRVLKNRQLVLDLSGGGAPFEVTVALTLDPATRSGFKWSSSAGPATEINPGTLSEGTVTVRTIRLVSLLIPGIEHLFDRAPR